MRNELVENKLSSLTITQLRGWAILGVIVIHATGPSILNSTIKNPAIYILILLNQLSRFCVPMFFFISGYLYANKKIIISNYPDYIYRRLKTIGLPYIFWSLFYLTLRLLTHDLTASEMNISYLINTFLIGSANGHLYFIPALFQFYILLPLFIYTIRRVEHYFKITFFFIIIISIVGYQLRIFLISVSIDNAFLNSSYLLIWWFQFVIMGLFWGYGYDALSIKDKYKNVRICLIIASFFLMNYELINQFNHTPYYYSFFASNATCDGMAGFLRPSAFLYAITSIPLFIYAIQNKMKLFNWVDYMGRHSFGIYLSHPFFNKLALYIPKKIGFNYILMNYSPWIMMFFGTGLTIIFVHILSKIKSLNFITGNIR